MIMNSESCNCIVCAREFEVKELQKASSINSTKFMICKSCLELSDPSEDYRQARSIVNTYLYAKIMDIKHYFKDAENILNSRKN